MGKIKTKKFLPTNHNPAVEVGIKVSPPNKGCGDDDRIQGVIATLLSKIQQDRSPEEKEQGLNAFLSLVANSGSEKSMQKHIFTTNAVRIIAPYVADSNPHLQTSAVGTLRNLSIYSGVDGCEKMLDADVMTPLVILLRQYSSPEKKNQLTKKMASLNTSLFKKHASNSSKNVNGVVVTAAKNPAQLSSKQNDDHLLQLDKLMSADSDSSSILINPSSAAAGSPTAELLNYDSQIFINALGLLYNLCENCDRAVQIFNREGILTLVVDFLNDLDLYNEEVVLAVANCILVVSEDNDDVVSKLLLNVQLFRQFYSLNDKDNSTVALIKLIVSGILLNVFGGKISDNIDVSLRKEIFSNLLNCLSIDHRKAIVELSGFMVERKESNRNSSATDWGELEDMTFSVEHQQLCQKTTLVERLLSAQQLALELMTNAACLPDPSDGDDTFSDGDGSSASGDSCEDFMDGIVVDNSNANVRSRGIGAAAANGGRAQSVEPMEEDSNFDMGFHHDLLSFGFLSKILDKVDLPAENVVGVLNESPSGKKILNKCLVLRCRSLHCLHNLIPLLSTSILSLPCSSATNHHQLEHNQPHDNNNSCDWQTFYSIWTKVASLIMEMDTDDRRGGTAVASPIDVELLESATSVLRSVVGLLAELSSQMRSTADDTSHLPSLFSPNRYANANQSTDGRGRSIDALDVVQKLKSLLGSREDVKTKINIVRTLSVAVVHSINTAVETGTTVNGTDGALSSPSSTTSTSFALSLVKDVGEFLLSFCCSLSSQPQPPSTAPAVEKSAVVDGNGMSSLLLLSETVDSLVDIFSDDSTDQTATDLRLVDRMQAILQQLKRKIKVNRRHLLSSQMNDSNYSIVNVTKLNLANFIRYKLTQGTNSNSSTTTADNCVNAR